MTTPKKRIALNFGGGYVPGLNSVIVGAALAATELGWEVVGIRDGFDGLLFPERYDGGALVELTPRMVENLSGVPGALLGTAAHSDPFHVRALNAENQVEEVDRSDELLETLRAKGIEAVVSVVGRGALSILYRLSRNGLKAICVPKSAENDVAATTLSFGFNSVLSYVSETLERARQAAQSARKIGVVEVPGEHAGWLALQGGMAAGADAVLIPEILFNLQIGDRIWLSEKVSGTFTFDQVPDDAHIVLIATGSGLAPYVSMLSTHLQFMTQRRVAVIHGVRHSWDLGYRSIFMTMQHLRTNFTYLPVVSRPEEEPVSWTGATGHVQDLWNGDALERAWGLRPGPGNTHVFLCGSPDMIEDMEEILVQEFNEHTKNTPGQIHVEKYWQQAKVGKR